MMKSVAVVLMGVVVACSALSLEKVHVVDFDSATGNFLFRGDMPCNDTAFAIDDLRAYMAQRAQEAGFTLPADYYLTDISLNNVFDMNKYETEFWKDGAHADIGQLVNWPLGLAGVFPPSFYNASEAHAMALGPVWWFDQMPTRMQSVRQMLTTQQSKPWVIYVHCTAGCDRTGQFIGSYRMQFKGNDTTEMYAADTTECGRSPNWFGTSGLEWYCMYYEETTGSNIGACTTFATCDLFGKCKPATSADADEYAVRDRSAEQIEGLPSITAPSTVLPLVQDDVEPVTDTDAFERVNLVAGSIREALARGDDYDAVTIA